MRVAALPHLHKFRKHADPQVRAAALAGLGTVLPNEMGDEVADGLQDPSDKVRIAAASVCFQTMEAQRTMLVQQMQQQRRNLSATYQGFTTVGAGTVTFEVTTPTVTPPSSFLGSIADIFTKGRAKDLPPVLESKVAEVQKDLAVKDGAKAKPAVESKPVAETKPATDTKPPAGTKPPAETNTAADKMPPAETKPAAEPKTEDEDPYDLWLKDYYAGKRRPRWAADLIKPLEKMLQAKNGDERLAAAIALVPLGKAQAVLPQVYEVAQSDPKKYREVMVVLPWLVWEQRLATFRQLRKIAPTPDALSSLAESVAEVRDPRAAEPLWELLADAKTTARQAWAIEVGLLAVHGIDNWYSSRSNEPTTAKKNPLLAQLARSAKARTASGGDIQRLVALALLTYTDPDGAMEVAEKFQADQQLSVDLRHDAFQILLALSPRQKGDQAAAAALAGKDAPLQKLALGYFVYGPQTLRQVRETIMVQLDREEVSVRTSAPIVPKPPAGLKISQILPLLSDSDPAVAAEAGYLLALMGESRGLEPLLRYAELQGKSNSRLQRLAYRAIAVLDDSDQIPLLRKIYAGLERYEVSEFYWTIRIMTGPEVLKFRKQIRDEVGMNQLQ